MSTGQHEPHACDAAVSLAFSILGKRWNGMIIDALGGGPASFTALRRTVGGISDAVLSDRLAELTDAMLLSRSVDPGPPVTVTYALTSSGEQLLPVLQQLGQWASENLALNKKP
ncbi:helix-turn-helix transcriptional regulator [Arthrobacter sp. I2-34]|uniref:Helix-turn-helix transcriptional regulator n=1 Tax=Arthrobacter hankyongi TaxID=2904801 RepID=A0ABS9LAF0_9MICC|nr:helix-turn-helix domain-containing protein [Arthrobacter hankyongi]MCG2623663.1 helix-turn-helix transcriptional regulator [Arthrobacter hankyongi]